MCGIYIHIPFCFHKCHYCDFHSIVVPEDQQRDLFRRYLDRLKEELILRSSQLNLQPRTLFVGGGTPTLLGCQRWEIILQLLYQSGVMSNIEEFTVEANPETIDLKLAQVLAGGGVNRLSLGAQSFNRGLLKTLERWHEPGRVNEAVEIAYEAGIENINLDMIFAIPEQTLSDVENDLTHVMALKPGHVSYYNLTYEPGTKLYDRRAKGEVVAIDEEVERQMYSTIRKTLARENYEHYEISNWAKCENHEQESPKRCQHNMIYWRNENWLGLGPSAASHVNGRRWKNIADVHKYLSQPIDAGIEDLEYLDKDRRIGEALMMKLRLIEGIELDWLDANLPADDKRLDEIKQLEAMGMVEKTKTHLRLTDRGIYVADQVIVKLL